MISSETDGIDESADRWPPKVSAHRLFTLGIVLTVVGLLSGFYLAGALDALRGFMGITGRIGWEVIAAISQLVGVIAIPLGVALVGSALVIRHIEDPGD